MAEDIEKVIYKLELDGSAYIEGADKLSNSTKKLSDEQVKANAKLADLQKTQASYKKTLSEINAVIVANEKETIELTKQLNALKDSQKGASAEAIRLKTALRDIAVNTKEFKSEAKDLGTNLTASTNQIKIQTKEVQSLEKANVNFSSGLTKVYTGLSRVAALIPGLGIGSLIAIIAGPLVKAFTSWFNALDEVAKREKIVKEITDNAIKGFTGEVVHLGLIKDKLNDLNIPQEKRIALAKDYNKTAEEGNRIDLKQIDNIDLLNSAIDRQIQKLKERAFAKAAENIVSERAEKLFLAQADLEANFPQQSDKIIKEITARAEAAIKDSQKRLGVAGKINVKELLAFADLPEDQLRLMAQKNERFKILLDGRTALVLQSTARELKAIEQYRAGTKAGSAGVSIAQAIVDQAKKDLDDALEAAKGFITIEGLFTDKSHAAVVKITNIYADELQKLKADIAKLDEKGFTNEASIKKALDEEFKKRANFFAEAAKKGQLTPEQLKDLNAYLGRLYKITFDQNIKSFREQKAAFLAQIQAELDTLQIEEDTKRISTIQDHFERERQMILSETEKTANALSGRRDKQIADISKNAAKNGLTASDVAPQIAQIKVVYSKLLDDLEVIKLQKLQQLSFDTFEKLSEDAKRLLDSGNLGISQGSLINIKAQTQLFLERKISYEKYQKELTIIARFEANERFRIEKLFLQAEIKVRQEKLAADKTLTAEQIKRLEDEIRRLKQQLADAEKGNETTSAGNKNKDFVEKLAKYVAYAQAIGNLAQEVIGFWQQANAAEQASLDRSIELQQKRVDAAQKIAERGNAQYLKLEEDRLKDLQVKKENAARKQLGINAALQGSEVLVALISGLAQGAKIGGGLGAIASVAAIVAAIAGAYAIAQSLKPPQYSFFQGTEDTGQGGNVDGKGGFTAILHPHEAIIPADKNKAYHPTVAAIYDGTIPAEHLNNFVNHYHKIKAVPLPNYERIRGAAEMHINENGRLSLKLDEQNQLLRENNDLQRMTLKAMKGRNVDVKMDRDGIAVAVTEYVEQVNRDKRI